MINKIGNVEIDDTFYSGDDLYSDGIIEKEIFDSIRTKSDDEDIFTHDERWPVQYHFNPNRRNLLEWYDFSPDSSLLEIGAGCGALTGLFCEKNKKVVAIELSKRRSEITAHRHYNFNNLKIKVGNLQDIKLITKFDYVTLIGVLEYAGLFIEGYDPFQKLLLYVNKLLKQKGRLILAIENKYGLKYWSGAAEDHSGNYFEGIQNYITGKNIQTFSKPELAHLLTSAGYSEFTFYYPYPDYKFPIQIFSDLYLPKPGQIHGFTPNYDRDRMILFEEGMAWDGLIESQMFDFFSNSFLVFAEKR